MGPYSFWLFCQRTRVNRDASGTVAKRRQLNFEQFIEDKLTQHGKALEQLLKSVQKNEDLTKTLLDNIGNKYVNEPKMPEKIEVHHLKTRRRNESGNDNAIVRLGKKIPVYGNLVKDMIMGEVQKDQKDPIPLVEKNSN